MKNISLLYIFFLNIFLLSFKCNKINNKIIDSINDYHNHFSDVSSKISLNGVFKHYKYDAYLTDGAIEIDQNIEKYNYFSNVLSCYNNGFLINNSGGSYAKDSDIIRQNEFSKLNNYSNSGVYYIENKKIKAILRKSFNKGNGSSIYTFAFYEGELVSKDTICHFKVVPPYPKVPGGFLNWNKYDIFGETLVFKPFPAKLQIDSTNFWIKQFIK